MLKNTTAALPLEFVNRSDRNIGNAGIFLQSLANCRALIVERRHDHEIGRCQSSLNAVSVGPGRAHQSVISAAMRSASSIELVLLPEWCARSQRSPVPSTVDWRSQLG